MLAASISCLSRSATPASFDLSFRPNSARPQSIRSRTCFTVVPSQLVSGVDQRIGLPNKGIARQLGISPKTVGNHVEHIYTKLGVTNRAGAALLAMRHGIVSPAASDAD